jgi:outer membrane protein insertion porin family
MTIPVSPASARLPSPRHWRCWLAALAGALLCACPAAAAPCSPPTATFTAVRFEADGWIDAEGLQKLAGVEAPGEWDGERAAELRESLLATEVFRSVESRLIAEDGECILVVDLERRPRVIEVDLSGAELPRFAAVRAAWRWVTRNPDRAPAPTQKEIRRLIPLRAGSIYEAEALERGTARILERYHAVGYPSASVATRVRETVAGVEVEVHVDPGEPRLVTQVDLRIDDPAARGIVEDVLEERLGGPEGRRLERDTRREIQRRLREEGYFESRVEVGWNRINATAGQLVADVDLGPRRSIEIEGNAALGDGDLIPRQELNDRIFISRNTWRQVAARMEDEYQRRGYYEASVSLEPERDDIVFTVDEGRKFKVSDVRFEGNRTIEDDELREVVATGQRGPLAVFWPPRVIAETLEEDVERIRVRYARDGFESARVAESVELDEEEGRAQVVFDIEEGPRTYVRAVTGDAGLAELGLSAGAARPGEPLDAVALENERERLVAELRRKSYFDAAVDVAVERQAAADGVDAWVVWRIEPGAAHVVGDVVIQGNWDVRYAVITRELPFERGAVVDTAVLAEVQQEIYEAGVFRHVSIAPTQLEEDDDEEAGDREPAPAGEVPPREVERTLAVKVVPRPPGRVSYGAGYDTRQGLTAFTELGYANLNHRARKLRLRGQVGFDPGDSDEPTQYLATAELVEPSLRDGPWTFQLNGLAERNTRTVEQYNIERFSVASGLGRKIFEDVHVGGDLQVERARVFDVRPVPFLERDQQEAWTTAVIPFVVYDGRDSVFNPQSGFFESLRLRYAVPGVSDVDLVEVVGQHTHLIPLWNDWGFVYSLRVGWVRSLDGDPIVPIRHRYFVGGGESVRGFAVNSLGPYDGNGNEVGGDLAIVTKTELRIPLIWDLGLVVFVDGGGNYLTRCGADCRAGDAADPATAIRDAAVSFDNFRATAGLGLRYVTPVGPISVDYGIKLDRRTRTLADGSTAEESFGEFSVSVGASF